MDFTVYEAETKALISCVFVFPYMQKSIFFMTWRISLKVPVKLHKDLVGSEVIVQKNTDDTSRNVRFVEKLVLIVM